MSFGSQHSDNTPIHPSAYAGIARDLSLLYSKRLICNILFKVRHGTSLSLQNDFRKIPDERIARLVLGDTRGNY